jgi:putative peptidoglycan lipid II flippase
LLVGVATSSINYAITPIFIIYYKEKKYTTLISLSNSIFNSLFIVACLFGGIQYLLADDIIHILLPGFTNAKHSLTVEYFKIQAFLSIITLLTGLLYSLHYTVKNYYRTVLFPIMGQILYITFVFLTYKQYQVYSLVYGLVINQLFVFTLLLFPFITNYRFKIEITDELKRAAIKIYPLLISGLFSKSHIIIDRYFASSTAAGNITLLQYGRRIIHLLMDFINRGISIVTLRKLSMDYDDKKIFTVVFNQTLKGIIFIVVPVSTLIAFFFKDILQVIMIRDSITENDVKNIYLVVLAFIGMVIGGSVSNVVTNAFYAKGHTGFMSKYIMTMNFVGIGIKITSFYLLGFWGLPIAFSVYSLINAFILMSFYNRRIYKLYFASLSIYSLRVIAIALIAVLFPAFINHTLANSFISASLSSLLFMFIYFVISTQYEKDISIIIYRKIKSAVLA